MSDAGNLVVTLTADQGDFINGMKSASTSVDEFGQHVAKGGEHSQKFSIHMLASRQAVGTFAAAVGTTSAPLMHLIHAFELGGPVIGGAIAAMLIFREIMEANAKAAEEAAKKEKEFFKSILDLNELEGLRPKTDETQKHLMEEQIRLGDELLKIKKQIADLDQKKAYGGVQEGQEQEFENFKNGLQSKAELYRKQIEGISAALDKKAKGQTLPGERHEGMGGGGLQRAVSAGDLGALHAERSTEVNLLQQIASNTAKMGSGGGDHPATNFPDSAHIRGAGTRI